MLSAWIMRMVGVNSGFDFVQCTVYVIHMGFYQVLEIFLKGSTTKFYETNINKCLLVIYLCTFTFSVSRIWFTIRCVILIENTLANMKFYLRYS